MAKVGIIVILVIIIVANADAQRNLQYPTTKKPAPTKPTQPAPTATPSSTTVPSITTTTTTTTTEQPATVSPNTPSEAPYPAAGYRPGRAFNLPTEEKRAKEPNSSYGPPTEEPSKTENAPYPPAGYRPGRAFTLSTETKTKKAAEPASSYGAPTAQPSKAPLTRAEYRSGRVFKRRAVEQLAASRNGTSDQQDSTSDNRSAKRFQQILPSRPQRIGSALQNLQSKPSVHSQQIVKTQRTIQAGPALPNKVTKIVKLRPNRHQYQRRPLVKAQAVLQSTPVYIAQPFDETFSLLLTALAQPNSYSFTSTIGSF